MVMVVTGKQHWRTLLKKVGGADAAAAEAQFKERERGGKTNCDNILSVKDEESDKGKIAVIYVSFRPIHPIYDRIYCVRTLFQ
jgi:hypothetical protein